MNEIDLERELRLELAIAPPERTDMTRFAEHARRAGLLDVGYAHLDSPLGRLLVAATPAGLVRLAFEGEPEEQLLAELARRVSVRVLRSDRAVDDARHQLDQYFRRRRRSFALALDWRHSTGFPRRVLGATARIPYGLTRTYRDVASGAESPKAVRSAGTALARNPLPIVVPCHRVLRSDGRLGDYRGGAAAKRLLLDLEEAGPRRR